MSDTNALATTSAKTIDDVMALLKVDERTSTGQEGHDEQGFLGSVPWVGYRGNKAKSRIEELNAAGVPENAFYLFDRGIIAVKPFFVHVLGSFHFYSQVDDDNNLISASKVLNDGLKKRGFSDHILALVLVRLPGETPMFKAATLSQRKAMTRAFDEVRSHLKGLEKDTQGREWRSRGEKERAALDAAKWPAFAVRARISGKLQAASTPGGRDFNLGLASTEATPLADVKALNRYMGFEPESYPGENKKHTDWAAALRSFGQRKAEAVSLFAEQEQADQQYAKIVDTATKPGVPPNATTSPVKQGVKK